MTKWMDKKLDDLGRRVKGAASQYLYGSVRHAYYSLMAVNVRIWDRNNPYIEIEFVPVRRQSAVTPPYAVLRVGDFITELQGSRLNMFDVRVNLLSATTQLVFGSEDGVGVQVIARSAMCSEPAYCDRVGWDPHYEDTDCDLTIREAIEAFKQRGKLQSETVADAEPNLRHIELDE